MRQRALSYTAISLWTLGGIYAFIIEPLFLPGSHVLDSALRIVCNAAIATSIMWGLGVVAAAIQRLTDTLTEISRDEQHRASYLRGQVIGLTHQVEARKNGHRPDTVTVH